MKSLSLIILFFLAFLSACEDEKSDISSAVITDGQMPAVAEDESGNIHLVYGHGDSILYSYSSDMGKNFSTSILISILPKLAASHMRGPQIAATKKGLVMTACDNFGDIFSFTKNISGKWSQTARVNDKDTTAKENLMALAADGDNAFAVWLDLRDGNNKIFGAKSTDGGRSWSKNIMVYASPDRTVCECCKPSVAVRGDDIYVMFRNWLDGNRDLYLIRSSDGGSTFLPAQKLGNGSWTLNGCPMDGGRVIVGRKGNPETVWNRKGAIYACEPGKSEEKLGKGRNCTMESVNGKNIYAWVEAGNIIIMNREGMKKNLGEGQLPVLEAVNNDQILCVWENDGRIHRSILKL
jgi:hypothetical protein